MFDDGVLRGARYTFDMTVPELRLPPAEAKREIRTLVRARRAARSEAEVRGAGEQLTAHLQQLVVDRSARTISCYLPINGEPDTRAFIDWAVAAGLKVLLPSSRADGVLDWVRASAQGTAPGAYGIPEPLGERLPSQTITEADLMLVPACAVDRSGVRLGWGRGYFDRTLATLAAPPPLFPVVYADEVFEALPREAHDIPVDGAVTPDGVLVFAR